MRSISAWVHADQTMYEQKGRRLNRLSEPAIVLQTN